MGMLSVAMQQPFQQVGPNKPEGSDMKARRKEEMEGYTRQMLAHWNKSSCAEMCTKMPMLDNTIPVTASPVSI